MQRQYYLIFFIFAGLYGCVGEIIINSVSVILRGSYLWVYYNGWHTSWESFILFGLGGCLAFYLFSFGIKRSGRKLILKK